MKKTIVESAKVGAMVGFSLAIVNAILVLIAFELSWPIPDPQKIVIFDSDLFNFALRPILLASPFWLIPSILIGGTTAVIFGYVLVKFHPRRNNFILICTLFCTLISGIYILIIAIIILSGAYTTNHLFSILLESPMIGIALLLFPSIFYPIAALYVSWHLYNKLPIYANIIPSSP